jgi:hypothetical protein
LNGRSVTKPQRARQAAKNWNGSRRGLDVFED